MATNSNAVPNVVEAELVEPGTPPAPGAAPVPASPAQVPAKADKPWLFQKGYDPRRADGHERTLGGRPPSHVRAASRLAYDKRIKVLEAIADGEPLPHRRRFKARAGKRLPDGTICTQEQEDAGEIIEVEWEESADIDQRMQAIEKLGKFGGLSTTTITDGEGGTIKPKYIIAFD